MDEGASPVEGASLMASLLWERLFAAADYTLATWKVPVAPFDSLCKVFRRP
jgi:hypothetical protein